MPDALTSLRHPETSVPDDAALGQASRSHVAGHGALQLIAELLVKLRGSQFAWWTPEVLREAWDATARMGWFAQRADIRQRITCSLTGLRPKAARNQQPDFQASLIDSVIDEGDVSVAEFETQFDAIEVAAYAPAAGIWREFRSRMPWDDDTAPHQALAAWLLERLLADSSTIEGMTRPPVLTAHALRTAIPGTIWHTKIPLDIRVAIDELRLARENAGEPFHASHDLSVATPAIIAANIPLRELLGVLDAAEQAMGLPASREWTAPAPRPARAEAPKPDARAQPAPSPADQAPAKAEPPRAEAKAQPAAAPAEKPAERTMDRWERVASKVLERVGKESEESAGKNR